MKKRLLSAFLVLAMVLTLLPSAAFAAEPSDGLRPADEYYTIDGKDAGRENAAITLHKTAKRLTNDTYEVTLTAKANNQDRRFRVYAVLPGERSQRA